MPRRLSLFAVFVAAVFATTIGARGQSAAEYEWNLPKGFPRPAVPADNPMTAAKVDLGRHLYPTDRRTIAITSIGTIRRCRRPPNAARCCSTASRWSASRATAGLAFTGEIVADGAAPRQPPAFHNTGLYNLPGLLSYPAPNTGLYETTRDPRDVGKFKAPTLRNIAVTAPYMHDGSVASLDDVLSHYAAGGRTLADGPNRGVGHDNPDKSLKIEGFPLTPEDRADVIAFLRSLTDEAVLRDPRFSNPWRR